MEAPKEYLVIYNVILRPNESGKRNWVYPLFGVETQSEIMARLRADGRIGKSTTFRRQYLTTKESLAV